MPHLISHWIHGRETSFNADRGCPVFNPAAGAVQAIVSLASPEAVGTAVASALKAQLAWADTPTPRRAEVLFQMRELIRRDSRKLAEAIGREHGKTIPDALGEIARGLEVVELACGAPHLMKGGFNPNVGGQIDLYSLREPVGVIVGISPFNFPVMIPLWMGAMAVACGCAFINKPSERTPSASLLLGQLWSEAGLPDGIWTVLNGDREVAEALITHPDVAGVSFVGSTAVAEHVYSLAGQHGKRAQAFGGAKNHMVVMPDADLDRAADALVSAGYGSAGQRCMAVSVAVPVGEGTAEALKERLLPRIAALQLGCFSDSAADFGPLVTAAAKTRVEGLIAKGEDEGAELVIDGRGQRLQGYEHGYFIGATLFDHVRPHMAVYTEEIFGPVLSMVRAESFDDAVGLINSNMYGNGVALFTRDGDLAQRFTRRVDVGMVGINVPIPVPLAFHHFGGARRSKFGDTQMYGPESVVFCTKMKTVSQRWPAHIDAGVSLAFAS